MVDGQPAAGLPLDDRGLAYGDGVFRTARVKNGRILAWAWQYRKLAEDARALGLACPAREIWEADVKELFGAEDEGVVKFLLTRGSGGRGYAPPPSGPGRRIVSRHPLPEYPSAWVEEGVVVRLCTLRLAAQPRLAGIKHLNRLENVLARGEWSDPGIAEGLLCDQEGKLVSGTMSNLFLRCGERLLTPRLDACGVAGVTRARVLALAEDLGIEVEQGEVTLATLERADEVFLTNSVIGLWPVRALEVAGRIRLRWPVGESSRELRARLEAADD